MAPSYTQSPFKEESIARGREAWGKVMADHDADTQIEGQKHSPIVVKALAQHLRLAEDPDHLYFDGAPFSLTTGFPVGVDEPLPRCDYLYDEKTKHRNYEHQEGEASHKQNYISARGNREAIRAHFIEEMNQGAMVKMTRREPESKYGDRLLIAGLGAIEKNDASFRVIHDATHKVKVNPRILTTSETFYFLRCLKQRRN